MTLPKSGLLVLNAGIELVPIRELPQDLRERLGGSDSDFVLSHRAVRANSQRVDAVTANLLAQFADPRRIAEAVVAHCHELDLDPARVLEQAYPLIRTLRSQGTLVDAATPRRWVGPVFSTGDMLDSYTIVRLVSDLADTEVYEAVTPDGMPVAIKFLRPDAPDSTRAMLQREATALSHLGARGCGVVPRLHAACFGAARTYLVMDWCEGRRLIEVVHGLDDLAHRVDVARALLDAYICLHASGVLHGDVHVANVLVGAGPRVTLVDFGGAVIDGDVPLERIGTVPFYEPEVARALLNHEPAPPPSALGEQYAVTALVFMLVARGAYLALSLEADRAVRQVVDDLPRPLADFGLEWPAVESVLQRGLAKDAGDRWATLGSIASAFAMASRTPVREPALRASIPAEAPRPSMNLLLEGAVSEAIEAYGLTAALTATGHTAAPTASLYAGNGGVAYALTRLACLRRDPTLLAAADVWIGHALREGSLTRAFRDGSIGHGSIPGTLALFHSRTGLRFVEALIRHAAGDELEAQAAVEAFIDAVRGADSEDWSRAFAGHELDATNGAPSLLIGSALLFEVTGDHEPLRQLGDALAGEVLRELALATPIAGMLGFAHGRSGAVHALLRWAQASGGAPDPSVVRELDMLAHLALERGGGLAWPVAADKDEPPWTGWCHGSAGHVITWTRAAAVFERADFLDVATSAGRHVWAARSHSGPSLCCGAAGEGLALLVLANATGDAIWCERGRALIADAVEQAPSIAGGQGLFRSPLGIGLAAAEALMPATAVWPLCDPP